MIGEAPNSAKDGLAPCGRLLLTDEPKLICNRCASNLCLRRCKCPNNTALQSCRRDRAGSAPQRRRRTAQASPTALPLALPGERLANATNAIATTDSGRGDMSFSPADLKIGCNGVRRIAGGQERHVTVALAPTPCNAGNAVSPAPSQPSPPTVSASGYSRRVSPFGLTPSFPRSLRPAIRRARFRASVNPLSVRPGLQNCRRSPTDPAWPSTRPCLDK